MTRIPLYVILFGAFPVLYAANANAGEVSAFGFAMALGVALAGTAICLAAARAALSRSWQHAALATMAALVLFWSYDSLATASSELLGVEPGGLFEWSVSGLCVLIILICALRIRQIAPARVAAVTSALNVAAVALTSMLMVQAVVTHAGAKQSTEVVTRQGPAAKRPVLPDTPDIYYIILDGYARADVLRQYYGLDDALVSELRRRGFFVADASTSNYFWTVLSLTSSLNMEYVEPPADAAEVEGQPGAILYDRIRDNAASHFLRDRGYRFVHLRSIWGATLANPHADQDIGCQGRLGHDEFLRALLDASWLRVLRSNIAVGLAQCYEAQFAALAELGNSNGPKFVFAHLLLPHHPYLFDRNGDVVRHVPLSNGIRAQRKLWEDKGSYTEQLLYANRRVLAAIDRIVDESPRPPIIIVQSDHGPALRDGLSRAERRRVRFANLAAFLLPGAPADLIPNDVTPVNEFRYIFNHYFDAGLPILPAKHFYSEYNSPLALEHDETFASTTGATRE